MPHIRSGTQKLKIHPTLFVLLLSQQAPTPDAAVRPWTLPAGHSVISGRVTDATTGAPLRGAQLRLTPVQRRAEGDPLGSGDPNRYVITARQEGEVLSDERGRYEFRGLAEGLYLLRASSDDHVMSLYGSPDWPHQSRTLPIELSADSHLARVDFALKRGSVIRGRVVDEAGRPVRDVRVIAVAPTATIGTRSYQVLTQPTPTNTDGRYAIRGVPDGRFLVQAVPAPNPANPGAGSSDYLATFHPSATDIGDAAVLSIKGPTEFKDIDLIIRRKVVLSISGRVLTAGGEIHDGTEVVLESTPAGTRYHIGGSALGDGTFMFPRLSPGRYMLWARSPVADGFEATVLPVALVDSLTEVHLVLLPTGRIKGRVNDERGETLPEGLTVVATLADGATEAASADQAGVAVDGSFTIERVFGHRILQVNGLPDGWTIKSILVGRTEVFPPHVTVPSAATIDDVRIVIGRR